MGVCTCGYVPVRRADDTAVSAGRDGLFLAAVFGRVLARSGMTGFSSRAPASAGDHQREGRSGSWLADEPDVAAERVGEPPADREPEPGTPILPRGGAVDLTEVLEHALVV